MECWRKDITKCSREVLEGWDWGDTSVVDYILLEVKHNIKGYTGVIHAQSVGRDHAWHSTRRGLGKQNATWLAQ